MHIEINVFQKNEKVISGICSELKRLGTFWDSWKLDRSGEFIFWDCTFSNTKMFARLGAVQAAIEDVGYFGINGERSFYLKPSFDFTFGDILDRLQKIESIEINQKEK